MHDFTEYHIVITPAFDLSVLFSRRVFLGWALIMAFSPIHSVQALTFTPVLVGSLPGGSISSNNGYAYSFHSMTIGIGGLFGFAVMPQLTAELGALYVSRGFDQESSQLPGKWEVTFNTFQFPFVFKYDLLPILAVGLGGYFSHGVGAVHTYPAGSPAGDVPVAFGAGSYSADDYGVVGSVTLNVGLLSFISLIIDSRVLYGIPNISQISGTTATLRDFQVLGGIRLGVPGEPRRAAKK